jgi:hypothetical protein
VRRVARASLDGAIPRQLSGTFLQLRIICNKGN